jgi:hypothetical protein
MAASTSSTVVEDWVSVVLVGVGGSVEEDDSGAVEVALESLDVEVDELSSSREQALRPASKASTIATRRKRFVTGRSLLV